jgi:divalent metal cation (Fe/Co/Zn/Cd) transporter
MVFLLAVLAALPSIAAFNSLDLLKIFGVESTITTKLSFWETLLLVAVIIICYILINSMNVFKLARIGLISRKASPDDIEQINEFSHWFTLLATIVSMVAVVIICGIAWGLESFISARLPQVPWYIAPVGLVCVIVLGVYIYWVGTGKQSEKKAGKDELEAGSLKPGANNERLG